MVAEPLHTVRRSLVPDLGATSEARHASGVLSDYVDDEALERILLVMSELVTNSVRHAGLKPSQRIELELTVRSGRIDLDVIDPGSGFKPAAVRPGSEDGTHGWGLWLVDRLADRWGVESGLSTRAWGEFDYQPPPAKR
jgi:anti-sigma regulatory factor (Ser/Thr protein kinase)